MNFDIEYDERFFVQPGEMKIVDDFGNFLDGEEAIKYLHQRKKDMDEKLRKRDLQQFLKVGMLVGVDESEKLYLIVDRFVYDKNKRLYDYKIVECEESNRNICFIDHEQVTRAFIIERRAKK